MNKPKCFMCGHDLIEKKTWIKAGWNEYKVKITGVTGLVCEGCKESIFSESCVSMLQKLVRLFLTFPKDCRPDAADISYVEEMITENNILDSIKNGQVKLIKDGKEYKIDIFQSIN